ncbi:unnamed protein product [Rotaria sp. Silwood2]|nr:unnamed protein product [Rotaria sp. Silwood2]CAF2507203.1 unnamed protein product [Rotaria sp. Silwood2]CAF2850009.1 unnamed protein product [Rotaria sp. Silwood2]CAF2906630.1 unnamed protein product [Rotaria sp. Silwood2]CAF3971774.1 unnamed protein product [Rotaria sp. Silwood2]
MSNFSKDHPSIRVFAPPGGRSANIFGVPEPEAPMPIKKNHMESDIFGCKKDNTDSVPVKQTRNITNNIFGNQPEQPVQKSNIYSDKNKSTIFDEAPPQQPSNKPDRQRSNIFATNEPVQSAATRPVSEKYKSSIFSNEDNDTQNKRQPGTRQGLRGRLQQTNNYQDSYRPSIAISIYSPLRLKDPNASRMGYNPINGEPYSTKDGLNSKVEQTGTTENEKESDNTSKTSEEQNGEQVENGKHKSDENGHADVSNNGTENGNATENGNVAENGNAEASSDKQTNGHSNGINGHTTTKNSHTSVRVAHPPGGRSNGPLW